MKTKYNFLLICLILIGAPLAAQPLTVDQVKPDTYALNFTASVKKIKLEWTKHPDNWTSAQKLNIRSEHDTVSISSPHPIIYLEGRKQKYFASARAITLQGAVNFRDLGGYITKDGHQVKWGKIYRSADISKLTESDLNILAELNIKMVCDLRGEKEVEEAPDKMPAGAQRILLSAGSENIGGSRSYLKYLKSPESADSLILSIYKRTDHLGKKYKPVFDELLSLKPDQALMFHCTAGKDRTGVGAALILYALGVDESVIFRDYEATNEYRKKVNEQTIKMMTSGGISERAAKGLMAADPAYLQAAFDAIKVKYGSMDLLLSQDMNMTPDRIKLLREKFLY